MDTVKRWSQALTQGTMAGSPGQSDWTTSWFVPGLIGVLAIFLIIMIVYTIYQMRLGAAVQLLKGPVDLFNPASPVLVDRTTSVANMAGTYTLAFYIKIDAVPDMRATATPLMQWNSIWSLAYNAGQEKLVWAFNRTPSGSTANPTDPETVILPTVPTQKWTQITIGFEGRSVDLYIDGALIQSTTLQNVPPSAASSITLIPGGLMGKVAWVQLWPRRLTVSETANNYTDTSDSQGRPYLGANMFQSLLDVKLPNLFCPSGNCFGATPVANQSQVWEFPYA